MRANNVLGIIYASTYDQSLPELTNMRTMGPSRSAEDTGS